MKAGISVAGGLRDHYKQTEALDIERTYVYLQTRSMMDYDSVAASQDFFRYGEGFFKNLIKKTGLAFLDIGMNSVKPYLMRKIANLDIAIIGFGKQALKPGIDADLIKIKSLVKELKSKGADIVIVLSSLNLIDSFRLAREIKSIDCILNTNLRSRNQRQVIKVGDTLIAFCYWQARRLSRLDLEIEHGRIVNFITFYFRHIKLDSVDKALRFAAYLLFQNCYYIYIFLRTRKIGLLGCLPGTVVGLIRNSIRVGA